MSVTLKITSLNGSFVTASIFLINRPPNGAFVNSTVTTALSSFSVTVFSVSSRIWSLSVDTSATEYTPGFKPATVIVPFFDVVYVPITVPSVPVAPLKYLTSKRIPDKAAPVSASIFLMIMADCGLFSKVISLSSPAFRNTSIDSVFLS